MILPNKSMSTLYKLVQLKKVDQQWQLLVAELKHYPTKEDIQAYLAINMNMLKSLTGLPDQEIRVWFAGTLSQYYRSYPGHRARAREILSKS